MTASTTAATFSSKRFCISAKFVFELLDAELLALDPLGAQLFSFVFERLALGVHLLLRAIEFVAAAMEIGDQIGGFARFGSEERAGALDEIVRKAEALRDGDAAGAAGNANHQAICGTQMHIVEFDGGVDDFGSSGRVGLQSIVMRGGEHDAFFRAEFVEERDGERGAFFGSGAGAHFIDEDERLWRRFFEHGFEIEHVRGKGGEIGGDGLFVADVHENAVENRENGALGGDGNARIARKVRRCRWF